MPLTYQGLGLECIYPDNWKLSIDEGENGPVGFTVESPEAAFFAVMRYPASVGPSEVISNAIEAMRGEYDQFESNPMDPTIDLPDVEACEANFYCLDFLVISQLSSFTLHPFTYLLQYQAEDRQFENLEQVFEAMTVTVLRSLGSEAIEDDLEEIE